MPELTVEAKTENLEQVLRFVNEQLETCDCPMRAQMQLEVAVEELFVNIAHYAYPNGTGKATVRFDFDGSTGTARITFADGGVPFDPLAKSDPDVTLSAEERQIGGLGIYMVKKSMDEITYDYKDGQNILTIRKNW